jgi:uncharacterized membrane protein
MSYAGNMKFNRSNLSIITLMILHLVGIIGTLYPPTSSMTIALTPINLLISTLLLMINGSHHQKAWLFLILAFLIGMAVEILGIQTGFPFGAYTYGDVLGPKLLGVPYVIGFNWFMLTYATGVVSNTTSSNILIRSLMGATMMVLLDLMIEPVAITLDYWQWESVNIPISNYISWWVIAFVLHMAFQKWLRSEKNSIAIWLVISQMIYFGTIILFY